MCILIVLAIVYSHVNYHHHNQDAKFPIIPKSFSSLLGSQCSPPAPGNHWSGFNHRSLTYSRALYRWHHKICSLCLTSFTSIMCFRFIHHVVFTFQTILTILRNLLYEHSVVFHWSSLIFLNVL